MANEESLLGIGIDNIYRTNKSNRVLAALTFQRFREKMRLKYHIPVIIEHTRRRYADKFFSYFLGK